MRQNRYTTRAVFVKQHSWNTTDLVTSDTAAGADHVPDRDAYGLRDLARSGRQITTAARAAHILWDDLTTGWGAPLDRATWDALSTDDDHATSPTTGAEHRGPTPDDRLLARRRPPFALANVRWANDGRHVTQAGTPLQRLASGAGAGARASDLIMAGTRLGVRCALCRRRRRPRRSRAGRPRGPSTGRAHRGRRPSTPIPERTRPSGGGMLEHAGSRREDGEDSRRSGAARDLDACAAGCTAETSGDRRRPPGVSPRGRPRGGSPGPAAPHRAPIHARAPGAAGLPSHARRETGGALRSAVKFPPSTASLHPEEPGTSRADTSAFGLTGVGHQSPTVCDTLGDLSPSTRRS